MAADIYRVTIVEALDSWLAEGSAGGGGNLNYGLGVKERMDLTASPI